MRDAIRAPADDKRLRTALARLTTEDGGGVLIQVWGKLGDSFQDVGWLQVPAAEAGACVAIGWHPGDDVDPVASQCEQPGVPVVDDHNPVIREPLQCCQDRPQVWPRREHGPFGEPAGQRYDVTEAELAAGEDAERVAGPLCRLRGH